MASLRTRLFLTLLYSWSFEFPLRADEWGRRLYRDTNTTSANTVSHVSTIITQLVKDKNVIAVKGYFAPVIAHSRSKMDFAVLRRQRNKFSQQKIAEIAPLLRVCRFLPWVTGVAVTGSVAVGNAKENDDTDLMIVCAPHRLWLTRPILIYFSQLYGKRRTWHGEEKNSWCFNLWCEPLSLSVPANHQSLYTAYEVCQAQWVINKDNTKQHFFDANNWVKSLLPSYFYFSQHAPTQINSSPLVRFFYIPIFSNMVDLANYISFKLQYWYMRPHMTRERVTRHFAAFHPRDTRVKILHAISSMLTY